MNIFTVRSRNGGGDGDGGDDGEMSLLKCRSRVSVLNCPSSIGPVQIVADERLASLLLKSQSIEGEGPFTRTISSSDFTVQCDLDYKNTVASTINLI